MSKTNNVPLIRFPEFHDDWDSVNLENWYHFLRGRVIQKEI